MKELIKPIAIGVAINLILPKIVRPFASPEEVKPANVKDLNMKQKLVHLMVHHEQLPISSSLVVGAIVGLSVYLGKKF
jgi:hypothetical protein|tara:strand:- start:161 stop:394 length:234 start_codon:yes stop_codon:yes gene_type:complete